MALESALPRNIPKVFNGRNKVFFFTDYEGTKIRQSSTNNTTVATIGMRSGDFSDPLKQRNLAIVDPNNNSTPFPGNIIPANRIDPVAQTLIKLYPTPQNSNVGQNFLYISPAPTNGTKWDLRGDANLTTKDNFFWRFSKQDQAVPASLILPPPGLWPGSGFYQPHEPTRRERSLSVST
jgi:hypothetical protein